MRMKLAISGKTTMVDLTEHDAACLGGWPAIEWWKPITVRTMNGDAEAVCFPGHSCSRYLLGGAPRIAQKTCTSSHIKSRWQVARRYRPGIRLRC
jgi:hypothetical protein